MATARSRAAFVAAGALVVVGSALGIASPAQAHNYLVASSPAEGETLTELPDAFFITTNDDLLAVGGSTAGFAFQIVDAAGRHYETGCVTVDGPTMSTVPRLGEPGDYTALWQIVSSDGHTVSDEISFTWAPADPDATAAPAPECDDPATPPPAAEPQTAPPSAVALSDVLWIGGAVLAVGIAIAVTIAVLSRKRR